jgi:AMMECR1 domain-containing protein
MPGRNAGRHAYAAELVQLTYKCPVRDLEHVLDPSTGGKPELRGCIGTVSPMPLAKGLKDYALVR